ncbi:hypothetical protein T492DRAFT_1055003 [Pavlovales sp. CCMP2436]|nr:hypothetical protein T492DRAFT_1055003 [Pavlovales sp. CCMP2436]
MSSLRVAALYNCAYACAAALRTAAASGDAQAQQAAEALVRGVAMAKMLAALNDEDADVVAAAAVALARLGRLCGAALFDDASAPLNSIGNTLRALLAHEAPCQVGLLADGGLAELLRARGLPAIGGPPGGGGMGGDDDEDEGGDPDAAAVDEAAWEAVAALMTGLARSLGDTWAVAFDALLPALLARAGADMPHGEQATAIGVVAETLERLGERHAARHTQALLPVALRLAATPLKPRAPDDDDDDDDAAQVVQNAVYCAGVLAAPGGPAVLGAMQQLLSALRPLLERGRVADRLSDNALGAVARVLRGSAAHLPLGEKDYRENEVTLRTLMVLFSDAGTQQILGGHRPGFLQLLASVVVQHDAAVVERLATQGVSDDDEAEDQEEQDDHLTPTMRAELAAFLAASGVAI